MDPRTRAQLTRLLHRVGLPAAAVVVAVAFAVEPNASTPKATATTTAAAGRPTRWRSRVSCARVRGSIRDRYPYRTPLSREREEVARVVRTAPSVETGQTRSSESG